MVAAGAREDVMSSIASASEAKGEVELELAEEARSRLPKMDISPSSRISGFMGFSVKRAEGVSERLT